MTNDNPSSRGKVNKTGHLVDITQSKVNSFPTPSVNQEGKTGTCPQCKTHAAILKPVICGDCIYKQETV